MIHNDLEVLNDIKYINIIYYILDNILDIKSTLLLVLLSKEFPTLGESLWSSG